METKVAKRVETEEKILTLEAFYKALYDKFIARFEASISFVRLSNIDAYERRSQIWERANSEIRYIRLKLESANLLEECYWHDLYNDMQQYIDGYIETSLSEFMKNFLEPLLLFLLIWTNFQFNCWSSYSKDGIDAPISITGRGQEEISCPLFSCPSTTRLLSRTRSVNRVT